MSNIQFRLIMRTLSVILGFVAGLDRHYLKKEMEELNKEMEMLVKGKDNGEE